MRMVVLLTLVALLASCAAKDVSEVVPGAVADSLLRPQTPVSTGEAIMVDSNSGVLVDRSRMRTPEHKQTLARFEPTDVTKIYREFRPLRKQNLTQSSLDSFLAVHMISMKELQAVLSEGDQLGWNTVDAEGRPIK